MAPVSSYVPDSPPAKLWELLRRNRQFRRTVARLEAVRDQYKNGPPEQRRTAAERGRRILDSVPLKGNAFGHIALQWLVPHPLFEVHHIVDAAPIPNLSAQYVSYRSIKIGRGLTPNPGDPDWCWFEDNPDHGSTAERRAQFDSPPLRWGPQITTQTSDDERLKGHLNDEIAEWREWFSSHKFTVDTPWRDSPPGFQRRWAGLWNNLTGAHQAAGETNFFQGWSLPGFVERSRARIKEANRCIRDLTDDLDNVRKGRPEKVCPPVPTRGGNSLRQIPQFTLPLSEVESNRMTQFSMFARHRAVILPRLISKQAAHEVFRRLASELSADLPRTRELLGTDSVWRVYLGIEKYLPAGTEDFRGAMGPFFRSRVKPGSLKTFGVSDKMRQEWIAGTELKPLPLNPTPKDSAEYRKIEKALLQAATEDRQKNRHFERWVQFLNQLSGATFPRLDVAKLEQATPR